MKKLNVIQCLNQKYFGVDRTPDISKHTYTVTQVVNATTPAIHEELSQLELNMYCESDDWTVTTK